MDRRARKTFVQIICIIALILIVLTLGGVDILVE